MTEWKAKGKNVLRAMKVDMQFLQHHCMQYLDLHADLHVIDHSQQLEAALANFKVLLLQEIILLLGSDLEWTAPTAVAAAPEEEVQMNLLNSLFH